MNNNSNQDSELKQLQEQESQSVRGQKDPTSAGFDKKLDGPNRPSE